MTIAPEQEKGFWADAWRPCPDEHAYAITKIEGEIPREIHGTLYRNGPSQRVLPSRGYEALHLFDGDGLVHAFRFDDGAVHYTGRFAKEEGFHYREQHGADGTSFFNFAADEPDPDAIYRPMNTNVVYHGGRLFALMEAAMPFEMDPHSLESKGFYQWRDPMLGMSVSAHPKIDGRTGQMVIHGYQPVEPYTQLYVIEPDGRCSLAETVDTPYPVMMHDIAITEHHAIILLCPVTFRIEEGANLSQFLKWEPELGLKFGIRSREPGSPVRWFEAPTPGYIFHPGNAYEQDGKIYMDACTYLDGDKLLEQLRHLRAGRVVPGAGANPFLYEFDLGTGECRERKLDDRAAEFPRCDDRRVGYANRYGYAFMGNGPDLLGPDGGRIVRYDRQGGPNVFHDYGEGRYPNEPVFVPRSPDAAEDDGFVLNVVYDGHTQKSFLAVLDAANLDEEPLAIAHLEHRVPLGFHGNFAAGVV